MFFSVIISFGLVMRETRFGKVIQSPHSPDSENHELYFLISRDNISQNVFFIPKVGKKNLLMSQESLGNDPRGFKDFVILGT